MRELLATVDSHEISEWMAFYWISDEKVANRLKIDNMGADEYSQMVINAFKGKDG